MSYHPILKYILDLLIWTAAGFLAFRFRLPELWQDSLIPTLTYTLGSIPVRLLLIWINKLHHQSWSRIGVQDLVSIGRAVGIGALVLFIMTFAVRPYFYLSATVPILEGVLAISFLGGARLIARLLFEREGSLSAPFGIKRVIVVGAGDAGTMISRELLRHREIGLRPIGFLDDSIEKQDRSFVGLPVLGIIDDLVKVVREQNVDEVLIAIPSAPGLVARRVVSLAQARGIGYRIIPGVYEILTGRVSVSNIRKVHVEDLLRRKPVRLNLDDIAAYIEGRVVLVTGAGGTIGSELANQCARFGPGEMVLFGRGENSLYHLERSLDRKWPELNYTTVIGDVQNLRKLEFLFSKYRPDLVLHTAAHKHVPMMELNPDEAVANNVLGTWHLVNMALKYQTSKFVNISTDKAVNPTSVMGASKRVAELAVELAGSKATDDQVFTSVRFGNVLESRGSVVPVFKEQIANGGPITVTHPDMIRYFMTVEEAARLVLQAASMADNGRVYVLDMGEPVKIADLATDLIRLSGLEPGVDIEIRYTGIRPGEKLFEELLTDEEGIVASVHEKIFVAPNNGIDEDSFQTRLERLVESVNSREGKRIHDTLRDFIPTYNHLESE